MCYNEKQKTNKKQNNQSIFHYLIFDWQLKMERMIDTLITQTLSPADLFVHF